MTERAGSPPSGRRVCLPPGGLVGLLDAMALAGRGERVSIGEITAALGPAGLGGAVLVPALVALSPATVVFGVASVCGIAIAVIAAQIMINAPQLWLPGPICRMTVSRRTLLWLRDRLNGPFGWITRRSRPRLRILMRAPLGHVPGAATLFVGLSMPVLELVPLSATTGGAAVTLMVLGLLLDDGLLVAAGLAACVGVALLVEALGSGVWALLGF
ncbi:exopolysaccharide biosynthesis protein [Rhodosalinus sp. K401]|uniref:exopolysaccharide biosynthesis protein n=1 Tax=Rhodosalinus sp. K401 TaxID=3239195 RepID=UPI00352462A2